MARGKRGRKDQPVPARPQRWLQWIPTLVAAVIYHNTQGNGFTLDDRPIIEENPLITSATTIVEIFTRGYWNRPDTVLYRPLTVASYALNHSLGGLTPWGYHAVNILLHAAVTYLIYRISAAILSGRYAAFLAALFFALHPVHVEAVANVTGRAELLSALFVLGALNLSLSAHRGITAASAIAGCYFLGLLSKENAIVFPGLWLVFSIFRQSCPGILARARRALSEPAAYMLLLATLAYLGLRLGVLGPRAAGGLSETDFVENPLAFASPAERWMTATVVLIKYLLLLAWPMRLSADYSYRTIPSISTPADPRFLAAALPLLLIVAAAVFFARRQPVYLLGVSFFIVSFSVTSNIVFPIGTIMAERLLYLPSTAFCWILVQAFHDTRLVPVSIPAPAFAFFRGRATILLLAFLWIPWAMRIWLRNTDWRDNRALVLSTLRTSPDNAKARVLMADIHFREGEYGAAEREYRRALEIYPDYAAAAINLGSSLNALNRPKEALELLGRFENRSGRLEQGRLREEAVSRLHLFDYSGAAAAYEKALRISEADALAHRNLGGIYLQFLNQPDKGRAHLRRSLELAPAQPGAAEIRSLIQSSSPPPNQE